jgi:UbiD family decarboxylase
MSDIATTKKKHFKSLRDYLNALAAMGDVREIKWEVDTNLEIGAIIRRTNEIYAPAPLFTNIRGHAGYRVVGAPFSYSSLPQARMARVALALGLAPATSGPQIVEALARATNVKPIPSVVVEDAPCHQNVLLGDSVDLMKFPTPLIHDGDGGRYFDTLGIWVLRTPDGKWTNWSIARAMLIDGKRMTGVIALFQHNGMIFQMWKERGEPMPFALVQGAEPAALFVGGMPLPDHVDESGYLGGLFGEALEVVRCKTVDLEVPATAEIVVEGHVALDETYTEGPMGEYHGYIMQSRTLTCPVYHVSAITHRDNPILPVTCAGKPVEEVHTCTGLAAAAMCLRQLRDDNIPATAAWTVPESAIHLLAVTVSRDWPQRTGMSADDLARRIAKICKEIHGSERFTRVLVTDDDIDLGDTRDLIWAWNSRCHPVNGRLVLEGEPTHPGEPLYCGHDREQKRRGGIEVLNCLLPTTPDAPQSTAFAVNYPKDLQQRILAHWDD